MNFGTRVNFVANKKVLQRECKRRTTRGVSCPWCVVSRGGAGDSPCYGSGRVGWVPPVLVLAGGSISDRGPGQGREGVALVLVLAWGGGVVPSVLVLAGEWGTRVLVLAEGKVPPVPGPEWGTPPPQKYLGQRPGGTPPPRKGWGPEVKGTPGEQTENMYVRGW